MMSWKKQGVQVLAMASILGFAVFATGCGSNSSSTTATSLVASTLALSPSSVSINEGADLQLSATGGNPPYSFSIVSPVSPSGGEITSSGFYVAPMADETVQVAVTDSSGNVAYGSIYVGNGSSTSSGSTSGTIVCNSISQCASALNLQNPIDGSQQVAWTNAQLACQLLGYTSVVNYISAIQYINCGNYYTLSEADGSSFTAYSEPICYDHDPEAYADELSQIECD
jgi:hypothetical protein